jgi:ribose transport system ATP-binding protein
MDDPTRGVDVGAKEEIYTLVRDLADRGVACIVASDNMHEVIGLSNRILVMRDGRIVAELEAPPERKPSEEDVVRHMV